LPPGIVFASVPGTIPGKPVCRDALPVATPTTEVGVRHPRLITPSSLATGDRRGPRDLLNVPATRPIGEDYLLSRSRAKNTARRMPGARVPEKEGEETGGSASARTSVKEVVSPGRGEEEGAAARAIALGWSRRGLSRGGPWPARETKRTESVLERRTTARGCDENGTPTRAEMSFGPQKPSQGRSVRGAGGIGGHLFNRGPRDWGLWSF
jgi:hypothetical protein